MANPLSSFLFSKDDIDDILTDIAITHRISRENLMYDVGTDWVSRVATGVMTLPNGRVIETMQVVTPKYVDARDYLGKDIPKHTTPLDTNSQIANKLKEITEAWDILPSNIDHRPGVITDWLLNNMKPIINEYKQFIKETEDDNSNRDLDGDRRD